MLIQFLLVPLSLLSMWDVVNGELTEVEVARVVQMLAEGHTQRYAAEQLGVSPSVINRAYHRYLEDGLYGRRPGQGRRRITTPRQDRYLQLLARRNRQSTARSINMDFRRGAGVRMSNETVRSRLHEDGMNARRPATGPILIPRHRRARLDFARNHQHWQDGDWTPVLFTNESRFTVSTNDRRVRVWRRQGERYANCNIVEVDHFGGGSVMVWAGIFLNGRTDLIVIDRGSLTGVRYRDEVLRPVVVPIARAIGQNFILMQDNARPHIARVVMNFLDNEGIETLDWPARSPDLNPIEHAWDMLGRRVRQRQQVPDNVQSLRDALIEEWMNIPQDSLRTLIQSMPRRCEECIAARGGHTHY